MQKVMLVCHGNICRSPMAETVLRTLGERGGVAAQILVASCAVSDEEAGNPIDPRAVCKLREHGFAPQEHRARRLTAADYEEYDEFLCMEERNRAGVLRLCGGDPKRKVHLLLDGTATPHDISDPWYSGDFETAFQEILLGCSGYLQRLFSDAENAGVFDTDYRTHKGECTIGRK